MLVTVTVNGKKVHEEKVAGPKEAIQLRRGLLERFPGGVVQVIDDAPIPPPKKRAASSSPKPRVAKGKTTTMSLNALQELHPESQVKPNPGGDETAIRHKQVKVLPPGRRTARPKRENDDD